jgi:cyclase
VQDFSDLFHAGADKVIINTYAVQEDPGIIDAAAAVFGSQAVVVSIEAKRWDGWWECYTDSGRIRSGREVFGWMQEAEKRGCGEFLVNCVDTDGRRRGFDIALAEGAVEAVGVPVVIGSGAGTLEHIATVVRAAGPAGIAVASMLHYGMASIADIKNTIKDL